MNIKISIVTLILLSFLNMGAISNKINYNDNSFNHLEQSVKKISEFETNGVKLQYKTKNTMEKEELRIKECLTNNINDTSFKEIGKNEFQILSNDFSISAKLWYEDNYNFVEIIFLNKNTKYTTMDLKTILKKIENPNLKKVQYFEYYEGKEKESDDSYVIDKLSTDASIQKIKLLDISNGYVGTGYLTNGDKANFAIIRYNTGSHIIIGTPIIFTTY